MTDIVTEIVVDQIDDPEDPMRSALDRDALFELADNIKQNGLINPITVRPKGARYEVVAGHRRLSACKIAGKVKIACVIRELADDEVFAVRAAENLERADVDVVDEARFIKQFIDQTGKSAAEVAKALRRSLGYVETRLLVGNMPNYTQDALKRKAIPLGVAVVLGEITDVNLHRVWTDMAARDGISIAQAEHWVRGWKLNQLPGGTYSELPPGDFVPGEPHIIKFKCRLSGIEDDVRHFHNVPIHESQIGVLAAVAEELQKKEDPISVT